MDNGAEVCSICLDEIKVEQSTSFLDVCSHTFHEECLEKWLCRQKTCPLCRIPVLYENTVEIQRYILTWIVLQWILQKYPKFEHFYRNKQKIVSLFQNFRWNGNRLFPVDSTSLSALKTQKAIVQRKIMELIHYQGALHRVHSVQRMKQQIQQQLQQSFVES